MAAKSGWVVGGGFVRPDGDMCVASEDEALQLPRSQVGNTARGVSSVMSRMPHKNRHGMSLVGEEMVGQRASRSGCEQWSCRRGSTSCLARDGRRQRIEAAAPLVVQALKKLDDDAMRRGRWKRSPKVAG